MRSCKSRTVLGAAMLAGLIAWASAGRADIVIFKDGYVLSGQVAQQNETIVDPVSGQTMRVHKGAFFVGDGARRITFSHQQAQAVEKKDVNTDSVVFWKRVSRLNSYVMDPILQVFEVTPWDSRWERKFDFGTISNGKRWRYKIDQRLTVLTPQFAKIDALRYHWSAYYTTSELGVEEVRKLLEKHSEPGEFQPKGAAPKKQEPPPTGKSAPAGTAKKKGSAEEPAKPAAEEPPASAKRLRIARFLTQAGWYDEAEKEYEAILKEFPEEKEKVTAAREHLRGLRNFQFIEAIELASQARQHARAQQLLARFPRQDVDEAVLERARRLRAKYESQNETLKQTLRLLTELAGRVQEKRLQEVASGILAHLNHDNVGRLEAFLGLAQQAERDREQKRAPDKTPDQLLALAATGWLLGKDAAEPKVESAVRLWAARRFVLDYLKTNDEDAREQLVKNYERKTEDAVPFDEIAQLIPGLPPPLAEKVPAGSAPFELKTRDLSGKRDGLAYWVQLPPEYEHGRAYPVVFALHQVTEGPKDMLARCSVQAALHGYILVAPAWADASVQQYGYSPEEHAAVLYVLRDLRRRFQVDSDRVFLLGAGEGGAMAYDVGLSHPDLFAGVLPVSGAPEWFAQRYAQSGGNGQHLPFYVVNGTLAGKVTKANSELLDRWLLQGYPTLHVEYGGRGVEWFAAEPPAMFDWMDHKKRASAFPSLGKRAMLTMRETDNHFYWVTADFIRPANLNDHRAWKVGVSGANISGNIVEGNQVVLATQGMRRLTVWLGRDAQGRDMIDFTKPVTIRVNGGVVVNARPVKPSLQTMLEDLYQRGDRQRLFFVKEKIDLK